MNHVIKLHRMLSELPTADLQRLALETAAHQWTTAENIVVLLEPFEAVTHEVSRHKLSRHSCNPTGESNCGFSARKKAVTLA